MKLSLLYIILALVCTAYGVFIWSGNSGTRFFLIWFLLAAVFAVLALCARNHVWSRLPGTFRVLFWIVLAAGLVIFAAGEALAASGFGKKGEPGLDYIIVLGAQVYADRPSVVLQYRLDEAVRYLNENENTLCIVTGGQGHNEPFPEAEGMKAYLLKKGIPENRILTEDQSRNTVQNIRNSMSLLDPQTDSVGILTNNFHVFRGVSLAKKAGIRHVCGIAARSKPQYLPNNMLREFFGIAKDFLAGNLAF